MAFTRVLSLILLAAAGLSLLGTRQPSLAQPAKDELPRPPSNISGFKDNPSDLNKAKAAFAEFAKYYADYISNPRVYSTPQEFNPIPGRVQTSKQLITDMNRFILVPVPGGKVGIDQADYIRELGVALDKEFKALIEKSNVPIVKVNAARILAAACRSGATAHYATVTELLKNANTPPEVKYYIFQAAENLLAAYDLSDYRSRKHSNDPKIVSELIAELQSAIVKPTGILPAPPAGGALSPEQVDVLKFIRRQAIRALAQVRFAESVPGGPNLYPAFTLAQVAESDPAIVPPPSITEIAEAVIGICNTAAPSRSTERDPYVYAMADAVATGIVAFATTRAASPLDKSIPWRGYGARLSEALKGWKPLFDPVYDPTKPTTFSALTVPRPIESLIAEAERRVLTPMVDGTGTLDVNGLRQFRDNTLRADKKWTLSPYFNNPKLTLSKGK